MRKLILVIDDEPEVIDLVRMRLETNHYDLITASDGVLGLAKAQKHKPQLIILDIIMPNWDGYSFLQKFKADENLRTIPVIVLTVQDHMKGIFAMEGVAAFILKPFDGGELVKKVREVLGE